MAQAGWPMPRIYRQVETTQVLPSSHLLCLFLWPSQILVWPQATMTFSGEELEEESHPKKEASSFRGRKAPELSLEWRDVTIQIRYCAGPDDDEQEFVELFPKVTI